MDGVRLWGEVAREVRAHRDLPHRIRLGVPLTGSGTDWGVGLSILGFVGNGLERLGIGCGVTAV